jgi:hypothetical protein
MRVLVACEFSGTVREAFAARGHDAWSCDLVESERPGQHLVGDVRAHLDDGWELMIAHPPCTYLSNAGQCWKFRRPERQELAHLALDFVRELLDAPIPHIAIENPLGLIGSYIRPPDQTIQPWQFGHVANKPLGLWLKDVPLLQATCVVDRGRFYQKANGKRLSAWNHVTTGRDVNRARIAAVTFDGIAQAMADQWSPPGLTDIGPLFREVA